MATLELSFSLSIILSPYPRACNISHSHQPHVGIISIFAKSTIALGTTVMDVKEQTIRAGSHAVPSPNIETKSQLLNLRKPLKYGLFSLKLDSDYFVQKNSWDLCQELGMASCSIQLSTQVQTSPHTWNFGTRVKWQVQLQCSQWLRLHILTTRDPCEPTLRVFILQHKYTNGSNHDNVPWVKATWEARYIS